MTCNMTLLTVLVRSDIARLRTHKTFIEHWSHIGVETAALLLYLCLVADALTILEVEGFKVKLEFQIVGN